MRVHSGWIREVRMDNHGAASAWIVCPESAVPVAGAYLLGSEERDVLPVPLFLEASAEGGFIAAPPLPRGWEPGLRLDLRGPLGRGFNLPQGLNRLGVAAFGETTSRLYPLIEQALRRGAAVSLFTDLPVADLPSAVEVNPLSSLPEGLAWADFLALDLPLPKLAELDGRLGLAGSRRLACPGQALLSAPMPCGGMADCGVCAAHIGRIWKLVCKDGPVFDLKELVTQ
jgi:hypothetical protein